MTIDEAIEYCKEKEDCSKYGLEHKQLREWLEELKVLRKLNKWISVSDRLPERFVSVLVQWSRLLNDDYYIDILYLNQKDEFVKDIRKINGVPIAWMPLPEPFKRDE